MEDALPLSCFSRDMLMHCNCASDLQFGFGVIPSQFGVSAFDADDDKHDDCHFL
jgi:hypothetical protein